MLMAILYCDPDRIAAAAFACDQMAMGDSYWKDVFPGEITQGSVYETAYVTIHNRELGYKLLNLGMDDRFNGRELATEVSLAAKPSYVTERAA